MTKKSYQFILIIVIIILTFTTLYSSAVIQNFHAETSKNKVILKWTTISEVNCIEFQIERSFDNKKFDKKATIKAEGGPSLIKEYEYEDKSVFRTTANTYYYRLRIVGQNYNSIYNKTVEITPQISGVRHTWGSIKAMFR